MAENVRYSQLSNILEILIKISKSRGKGLSLIDIQKMYDCSYRTAYRYLQSLLVIFPQIDIVRVEKRRQYWGFKDCSLKDLI